MVDPINYGALMTQLDLSPVQNGLRLQSNNRAQEAEVRDRQAVRQLARQQFEADQAEHAAYIAALDDYKNTDIADQPRKLRDLGLRFPKESKALREAGESYTAAQNRDMLSAGFGALGAISAGKPALAIKTLQDRVTALRGHGIDTSHTQAAVDLLKDGKVKEATAYLSYAMGGLVGEDHAAGVLETLGVGGKAEDRRADNERADRNLELGERRVANAERATTAAIAGRARDDARADRKAAGGGKKAGKLPAGFILD